MSEAGSADVEGYRGWMLRGPARPAGHVVGERIVVHRGEPAAGVRACSVGARTTATETEAHAASLRRRAGMRGTRSEALGFDVVPVVPAANARHGDRIQSLG